ncbi:MULTISPECIES: murein hydrolase activator EnvC family protein [spotted fever group]|uniref:Peptidoglycan-specific endopeptidase, M23 family n=3 Tax=spotted fever group TaxID=114277 RepID=B0BWZ0_RICRO|nr:MULTISPECIES: M23 family metallopeptidase [spotted fever group]ABY72366.1 peptidoglycan-specific endopeptidase, M23 family [Rickettsia rickettsii str. Iowa]AFB22417.1 peptidoglycan-specific endopeptidase, M23 family protein [Rickettsia rickettsii str. Brazil]AFB23347.1 peptidoglycan-specific endopeptidase, M23 family protein [Rickettsia rickettsii str. Colombia]AFB24700.1 peptidoglycan-specific endopeptidase, M23 family protein [Rickettsia rickettsii str. Arizona]AFB27385.1 peptidoglycan-sp
MFSNVNNSFVKYMKYPVVLSIVICFCLVACVDQPPAPIEYKVGDVTANNNSTALDHDEGMIVQRTMEDNPASEKVSGRLEEPKAKIIEDDNDDIEIPMSRNEDEDEESIEQLNFVKPLNGVIITEFKAGKSKGIDIVAKEYSEVKSIAAGTVIYSGYNKQFGNLVIVKLDKDDLEVAYASLDDLLLKKGDKIARNSVIGHVEHKLYFAMRKNKIAVDPNKYIEF